MPTTIEALIIILFALLPGVPAQKIYRTFMGKNWKETELDKVISIIGFSIAGLLIYIFISTLFHLPAPIYIFPTTYNLDTFGVSSLTPIAISYLGQFITSAIVAILTVPIIGLLSIWAPTSPYPSAWDDFLRSDVPNHWVIVQLTNSDAYAGMITYADLSVCRDERDIVLTEPAKFISEENKYKVLQYQHIFLPASLISSIAVVYDPIIDKERISQWGSILFSEKTENGKE